MKILHWTRALYNENDPLHQMLRSKDFKNWSGGRAVSPLKYVSGANPETQRPQSLKDEGYSYV
jgi:hypothetical protein